MSKPISDATGAIPFYTVKQVARRWQCSEKSVRRLVARGELIAHRLGGQIRVSDADLSAYERANRCPK